MFYVYILVSKDDQTYIGCTEELPARIKRHNAGHVPATKKLIPLKLHCYFAFTSKYTAYSFEKYLKSGSGRAFMKKRFNP